jgi:hypothetical protein
MYHRLQYKRRAVVVFMSFAHVHSMSDSLQVGKVISGTANAWLVVTSHC